MIILLLAERKEKRLNDLVTMFSEYTQIRQFPNDHVFKTSNVTGYIKCTYLKNLGEDLFSARIWKTN